MSSGGLNTGAVLGMQLIHVLKIAVPYSGEIRLEIDLDLAQ